MSCAFNVAADMVDVVDSGLRSYSLFITYRLDKQHLSIYIF